MFIKLRSSGPTLRHGQELTVLRSLWEHSPYGVRLMLLGDHIVSAGQSTETLTSEWTANTFSVVAVRDGSLMEA